MQPSANQHIYSLALKEPTGEPRRPTDHPIEPFYIETKISLPKGEIASLVPFLHCGVEHTAFFHFEDVQAKLLIPPDRLRSTIEAQKARIRQRDLKGPVSPLRAQVMGILTQMWQPVAKHGKDTDGWDKYHCNVCCKTVWFLEHFRSPEHMDNIAQSKEYRMLQELIKEDLRKAYTLQNKAGPTYGEPLKPSHPEQLQESPISNRENRRVSLANPDQTPGSPTSLGRPRYSSVSSNFFSHCSLGTETALVEAQKTDTPQLDSNYRPIRTPRNPEQGLDVSPAKGSSNLLKVSFLSSKPPLRPAYANASEEPSKPLYNIGRFLVFLEIVEQGKLTRARPCGEAE